MKNISILRKKILFTLFIIVVYRLGSHIPLPTVDISKINEIANMTKSGIFSMFNAFSGGAISRASIFALGIAPYITASIIMQLLVASYPSLKKIKKEGGEQGAEKIGKYTRMLAILVAFAQGYSISAGLISMGIIAQSGDVMTAKLLSAFIITTSTMIVLWLGDQITSHGIGNGTSVIIFSGIISEAPKDLGSVLTSIKTGALTSIDFLILMGMFLATCCLVAFLERAYRMIYVQYPRQNYQNFMMPKSGGAQNHQFIPLKINISGVIPPIFASAVLLLPSTIASFFANQESQIAQFIISNFAHGTPVFIVATIVLIYFFSYFYNTSLFETDDLVNNLQKSGAFIPGVRPGAQTTEYFKKTLKNLSIIGGTYLAVICAIPETFAKKYGYSFLLGGTGLLIVCSVINDIATQIQTHMMSGKYEKIMKKQKVRM